MNSNESPTQGRGGLLPTPYANSGFYNRNHLVILSSTVHRQCNLVPLNHPDLGVDKTGNADPETEVYFAGNSPFYHVALP